MPMESTKLIACSEKRWIIQLEMAYAGRPVCCPGCYGCAAAPYGGPAGAYGPGCPPVGGGGVVVGGGVAGGYAGGAYAGGAAYGGPRRFGAYRAQPAAVYGPQPVGAAPVVGPGPCWCCWI